MEAVGDMAKHVATMSRGVGKTGRSQAAQAGGSAEFRGSVLEEARRAGLLDGEKTEHVSFRAPAALVEAAQREAGVSSKTELGVLALAMLARPDPVAAFFRETTGALGPDHDLEY